MFQSFSTSWQLVKASWAVLRADKEMVWFPVISGVVMLGLTIAFFVPMAVLVGLFSGSFDTDNLGIINYVVLFVYYFISYSVVIFFNTALVACAQMRLDGGDPTVRYGLSRASERITTIFAYAAISATVGVVLRFIQERGGILGSIVSWLGGMAWNIATFLVVPILVSYDIGPVEAIKKSTQLLRKTWGEQLIGGAGMGLVFGLLTFGVLFGGILLIVAVATTVQSVALAVVMGIALFLLLIAISIVSSALSGIYQAVLYRYAETGVAPDNFDVEVIRGAFKPKRKNS